MKVRIGEFDVECTVEEFEKLRKAKTEPLKGDASEVGVQRITNYTPPLYGHTVGVKPLTPPLRVHTEPEPPAKDKVVRGVKSLVVGTVGKYGQNGLTLPQIITMSGLERSQVKSGIYTAINSKSEPPLLVETNGKYFCTQAGENYAITSNFGERKILHVKEYAPKEGT